MFKVGDKVRHTKEYEPFEALRRRGVVVCTEQRIRSRVPVVRVQFENVSDPSWCDVDVLELDK